MTDDTAAINLSVSSGNRCGPGSCQSTTTTPAVVYFPVGTYLISSSIVDHYFTQIIGNLNRPAVLKSTPGFVVFGLIDRDVYEAGGVLGFGVTNVFFRRIRNMIFDLTSIPLNLTATSIHSRTSQATSIQNVIFKMSDAQGTQHPRLFIEISKLVRAVCSYFC